MSTMRTCTKCNRELPATTEYFSPAKRYRLGLRAQCRACRKEGNAGYNARYAVAYYRAHRQDKRSYDADRYAAQREAVCARVRSWKRENPGLVATTNRNREARLANAPGTHSAADVQRIRAQQGNRCFWCGAALGRSYHVDHYIPLSKGGSNWPENLDVACGACNLAKGAKMPGEFARS